MAFEPELRIYLEQIERTAPSRASVSVRRIDEHELHHHLLARLHELSDVRTPQWLERLFTAWSRKVGALARFLETLPRQLAPVDDVAALAFARGVLDAAISYPDLPLALANRLEMQRIAGMFASTDNSVEAYALENRLVRSAGPLQSRMTELGRVFLRLRGKDAIRWLMTCEVIQSTGVSDPWRASRELLEAAMSETGLVEYLDEPTWVLGGFNDDAILRLTRCSVLEARGSLDGNQRRYLVTPAMRDCVHAVLEPGPWHAAVRALLEDERALLLPGSSASAAEATVEQTKLIAHEVRNALIPVRHDIDALRSASLDPAQQLRLEGARGGVVRVLAFVDEMVQASEVITEPPSRCAIAAVVEEALGWSDGGGRVAWQRPPDELHIVAPRTRLARAISNIVGNALQATTAAQPVRIAVIGDAGCVRVTVDDGGPGVAPEDRTRIFSEGVTMRKDGAGSGFGLAFARRVVEGALQGKLWCEDSDLGGARFVIELPEASRE